MHARSLLLAAVVMAACTGSAPAASSTPRATASFAAATPATPDATLAPTAARYARAQPASPAPPGLGGTIKGRVSYPAELLPPEAVYAVTLDGRSYYRTETAYDQGSYTISGVAAGDYLVYADSRYPREPDPTQPLDRFDASYSRAVACGLSVDCADHTAVPVHVGSGTTTPGVDPIDWYGDPSTMPLVPGNPWYSTTPRPGGFATPESAALFTGSAVMGAKHVSVQAACDVNIACFALDTSAHQGDGAAYVIGTAGSNQDVVNCTFYEVHATAGWEPVDIRCSTNPAQVPFVGAAAQVSRSKSEIDKPCVNAYASASASAKVVACLTDATRVTIDGGPAYTPTSPAGSYLPNDLWWHLAGEGWVNHTNLYI